MRIELGQRQVSAVELFLLAIIYGKSVGDLLPTEPAELNDAVIGDPAVIRKALTRANPGWHLPKLMSALEEHLPRLIEMASRDAAEYPGASGLVVSEAAADEAEQAVKDAARKLNVPVRDVAVASRCLWERSLTSERDARVNAMGPSSSARARQARRGHITRALLREIETFLPRLREPRIASQEDEDSHG